MKYWGLCTGKITSHAIINPTVISPTCNASNCEECLQNNPEKCRVCESGYDFMNFNMKFLCSSCSEERERIKMILGLDIKPLFRF